MGLCVQSHMGSPQTSPLLPDHRAGLGQLQNPARVRPLRQSGREEEELTGVLKPSPVSQCAHQE